MSEITQESREMLAATFLLGQAVFGVDTACIQEVVRLGDITPVRHAPEFVVGIRNLRGRIVTVIDLRARLRLGRIEPGPETRILILDGHGEPIGMLVDQVADTITISTAQIQPAPPNVNGVQSRNLLGICRGGGRLVALLDVAAVLEVDAAAGEPASGEGRSS
jgi:purine-binding chemotaxis protein CheW